MTTDTPRPAAGARSSPPLGRPDRRPDHLRRLPVRRARPRCAGSPAASTPSGSRRCASSSGGTAGRSSSPGGCCPPGGSRCCSPPVRWPTRGAGCCPPRCSACVPLGGRLRAARRRQRRHLRLPAAGHPARHLLVLLVGAVLNLVSARRRRPPAATVPDPEPEPHGLRVVVTAVPAPGRLLRTGRTIARVLLTWAIATGALDRARRLARPASTMRVVVAAAGRRPAARPAHRRCLAAGLRVALPLAFFTLGLGGFLLLGAGVLARLPRHPRRRGAQLRDLGRRGRVDGRRLRPGQQRAGGQRGRGLLPPGPPPGRPTAAIREPCPPGRAVPADRRAVATTPRAAPSATGRCPRWPPGCARAATC